MGHAQERGGAFTGCLQFRSETSHVQHNARGRRSGHRGKPWSLERSVEMTEIYWQPKLLMLKKEKQWQRRLAEDQMFADALAEKP